MALTHNAPTDIFAAAPALQDVFFIRKASRMYSTEAASIVARLDWSDATLADRVEAALIVGAPFRTTTSDGAWAIIVEANRRVSVADVTGAGGITAPAMSVELLDLHEEFFAA